MVRARIGGRVEWYGGCCMDVVVVHVPIVICHHTDHQEILNSSLFPSNTHALEEQIKPSKFYKLDRSFTNLMDIKAVKRKVSELTATTPPL
jgi:hypothetical protein